MKYILKKACEGIVPEKVLHKKKQGFAMPRDKWLGKDFLGISRRFCSIADAGVAAILTARRWCAL